MATSCHFRCLKKNVFAFLAILIHVYVYTTQFSQFIKKVAGGNFGL